MDQMTVCTMKGVSSSDDSIDNYHYALQLSSATSFSASFNHIFLVSQPAILLFCFALAALINPVFSSGQLSKPAHLHQNS